MLTGRATVKLASPDSAEGSHLDEADFTEDAILNGRVRLKQPKRGYRINLDTVLLAAALHDDARGRVCELGCGVGAALLALAKADDGASRFIGIERDPLYAALARENVARNGLGDRARIVEGDALGADVVDGVFDRILFNPPYDDPAENRAPSDARASAHVAERPLDDWIKVWSNRMASGASFTLIHRAQRLGEILAAFEGRLGGVEILPVRPHAGAEASRIVVRAWKASRAPLRLHAGLTLHPAGVGEKYTPETEAIVRGEAGIWPG